MKIKKEYVNSIVILNPSLTSETLPEQNEICFDNLTSNLVTTEIQKELHKGNLKYILDLNNVEYIYSYGISIIIEAYQTINIRGGKFFLLNPNKIIQTTLKNLLSNTKIQIFFNINEAIESMEK